MSQYDSILKKLISASTLTLALTASATLRAEETPPAATPSPTATPKPVSSPNLDPLRLFDGSSISVRYRNQHDATNKKTFNQAQYIADFRLTLQLDREGKLNLKAVVGTAADAPNNFNADPANMGLGNSTTFNPHLYVRNFYADYKEGKSHLAVGSLPTTLSGVNGAFNIDSNGWINGAFYQYTVASEKHWIRDVAVTVGQMDIEDSAQIWKRDFDLSKNIVQIDVRGDISEIAKYTVEATNYDSEQYLRGILELATKDILKFVDQVSLEEMIGTGDQVQQGFALSLKKKLKDETLMSLVYSRKEDLLKNKSPQLLMMEDNFRPGDQLTFKIERPINKAKTMVPFMRVSKTLNKMFTVPMTSGSRFETGVKIALPKSKRPIVRRPN